MTVPPSILHGDRQVAEAITMADNITPPGKSTIVTCPESVGVTARVP
jgi:hypothetical protein